MICSMCASNQDRQDPCRICRWTSKGRTSMPKATQPVYIEIPFEDFERGDKGKVARLNVSLYGTRDAAQNWAKEYPPSEGDRTGRPGTTDEQRVKNTESTRAAPQESGGQTHLMEDEIDIYETDLAESMAIWDFGEDDEDHTSLQ